MERTQNHLPARRENGGGMERRTDRGGSAPAVAGAPWQLMRQMQSDMDRLFSQFFGGADPFAAAAAVAAQLSPNVDISETNNEIRFDVELPGVQAEDIEIRIQDHQLYLRAEMQQPVEAEGEERGRRFHRRERVYGVFERVIPLPENVREEETSCEIQNGVLTIHVPKAQQQQQQQPRRIPVHAGDTAAGQSGQASRSGQSASSSSAGQGSGAQQAQSSSATGSAHQMAGAKGGETSGGTSTGDIQSRGTGGQGRQS